MEEKLSISKKVSLCGLRIKNILVSGIYRVMGWCPDALFTKLKYRVKMGHSLNLKHPKLFTEKMQWIKLYDRNDFQTICADKYAVRDYLGKSFGEEYLIPLLYETTNVNDIKPENIPDCHCILKTNHDSGHYLIIRDKTKVDYAKLRVNLKSWLARNYYNHSKEWQYKNINPHRIIVEKLLETKAGKIPNDYKLHYINGELQFVYVAFDREGVNDRCVFDKNWNRLPFVWVAPKQYYEGMNTTDVPCPDSFAKMKEFGDEIAKKFKVVRVDFYDVDGKLYFGEITLHHGSGMDHFYPAEYDKIFGDKLVLN